MANVHYPSQVGSWPSLTSWWWVLGIAVHGEEWINGVVAWVAAGALYLEDCQASINRIVQWRKQVREDQAEQPPEEK